MKHSNFSNYFIICLPSFFSIIEVIIEFNIIHNFFLKDKSNLYMYLFIESHYILGVCLVFSIL